MILLEALDIYIEAIKLLCLFILLYTHKEESTFLLETGHFVLYSSGQQMLMRD